jgi:flavin-dependent dehydrogenase
MTQAIPASPASDANTCEVLIIGGGPAGATMAALLARQGRKVVLLEKDRHPRFHIGESLLPANVKLLEEMGLREQVEAIGMPKWGVEFVSPDHEHQSFLEFAEAWDKSMPMAWQVRRADFDQILFRHATASGATTIEGCKVRAVDFHSGGASVESELDDGAVRRWSAKFVVDASGRDTLLANQFKLKQKNPAHNSAALFGHFSGARRLEGQREGNISIFWFAHGWFWFIPLADGTTSVGAVCWPHYLKTRDKPLDEFFADTLAMCPRLSERLQDAQLVDQKVYATGNYSYGSSRSSGDRYLLLGDAYAFVDPVFSSGVYLAMASAFAGVEVVAATLDRPREAPAARRRFERHMRKGPADFSWFIFRMTNPAMRDLFMYPRNPLRVKEAVLALLAGDIFGRSRYEWRLRLFKGIYYIGSMINLPRTLRALRLRRENIRDVGAVKGENVVASAP